MDKNRNAFSGLLIKLISWLRPWLKSKSPTSLIIEATDPKIANCIIDEKIVIGANMHLC